VGRARVSLTDVALHLTLLGIVGLTARSRGVPAWMRAWIPLCTLPFLYGEMPAIIAAAGNTRLLDSQAMRWELAAFGEQLAQTWAARWASRPLSEVLHAAYLSYYAIIFSVPAALWRTHRRSEFIDATFVLLLVFVVCFVIYIFVPVAGPRYYWQSPADNVTGPVRQATLWVLETGSSRGTAFPSSHVAVAITQSLLGLQYFGWRASPLVVLAIGLSLGAIYGGFHYAVDVVAGGALGALLFFVGRALTPRRN
jgi:membrane-associated phospholipid phosphatase